MLTGDPPFTSSTVQAIVAKVLTEKPMVPTAARADARVDAPVAAGRSGRLVPRALASECGERDLCPVRRRFTLDCERTPGVSAR